MVKTGVKEEASVKEEVVEEEDNLVVDMVAVMVAVMELCLEHMEQEKVAEAEADKDQCMVVLVETTADSVEPGVHLEETLVDEEGMEVQKEVGKGAAERVEGREEGEEKEGKMVEEMAVWRVGEGLVLQESLFL